MFLHIFYIVCIIWITYATPLITPNEILVVTVVDPNNYVIIRDAITLIRSIRLYGGLLNQATILVCFSFASGFQTIDQNIIASFVNLGTQITFIQEAVTPYAKTMNKFKHKNT